MRRGLRLGVALATLGLLGGCSALINPDEGRLGGSDDAGTGRMDSGPGTDAGPGEDGGPGEDAGPEECPGGCDDGVSCTVDRCVEGRCINTPNESMCPADQRCNPVLGCVPRRCTRDAECDDGLYCNGAETCDPAVGDEETGCVPGEPVACADSASCTTDRCDEDLDRCVFEPDHTACADSVDCTVDTCEPGGDSDARGCVNRPDDTLCDVDYCTVDRTCDPSSGCVGGTERDCRDGDPCTADTCNEGADRCDSELRDEDMDGFGPISVPGSGGPIACGGMDCDDGDDQQHPGATELCNGEDDDCDEMIDEGCPTDPPDDCGTAEEIVIPSSGTTSVRGSFGALTHDYQTNPVCSAGSGGRDAVYYFDLPSGRWDVTIDTIGSAADTVLGIGFDCSASGLRAACNDDYDRPSVTHDSRIWLHDVGAGFSTTRVWVLVDAYSSSETGDYVLNIDRRAAAPDRCPGGVGTGLPLDISGGGTVVGVITSFTGSQRGTCQSDFDTSPEAVFRVRGPSTGNVEFDVYSTDFTPDIYLRQSPCGSGSEVGCDTGSGIGGGVNAARLNESVSSGDLHYLFVDNGRGSYAVYYQPY